MNVHDLFPGQDYDGFSREIVVSAQDHGLLRESIIEVSETAFFHKNTLRTVQLDGIPFDPLDIPLDVLQQIGSQYIQAHIKLDYQPNQHEKDTSYLDLQIVLIHKNQMSQTTIAYTENGDFSVNFYDNGAKDESPQKGEIPKLEMTSVLRLLHGMATPGTLKLDPTYDRILQKNPVAALEILTELLSTYAKFAQTTDDVEHDLFVSNGFHASAGIRRTVTESEKDIKRKFSLVSQDTLELDTPNGNTAQITRTLSYEFFPDMYTDFSEIFKKDGSDLDDFGTSASLSITADMPVVNHTDDLWLREIEQREVLVQEEEFRTKLTHAAEKIRSKTKH